MLNDYEKMLVELNNKMVDDTEKEQKKKRAKLFWLNVGKWFSDHLIELAALILSLIALLNTLKP